jgi:ribosomal-protein-alanine N-acetyltransferase
MVRRSTGDVGLPVVIATPTTIRDASFADIPQILMLERSSATAAHWTEADYARILAGNDRGDYLLKGVVLVAEASVPTNAILGFIVARAVGRDWEIENIVIAAVAQRAGHGSRLLRALIDRVRKESAEKILLEVRASNHAAIAMYKKSGFEQDGCRKNYYSNPDEDALLLRLVLI